MEPEVAAGTGAEHVNWADMKHGGRNGDVTWAPATVSDIQSQYSIDAGNGTLDLSHVDFTDHSVDVELSTNVGDLVVILPPKVDVESYRPLYSDLGMNGRDLLVVFNGDRRHLHDTRPLLLRRR